MARNIQEERDRLRDNLRRMGCYLILDAYEDLKRWVRPQAQYTQRQFSEMEEEDDPLEETREFFFGEDGLDVIIETFQIHINANTIRLVAGKMLEQAEACIAGEASQAEIPKEAWDLLMETISQSHNTNNQKNK